MPTFYCDKQNYYIVTNYKVLFSTLKKQEILKRANRKSEILSNLFRKYGLSGNPKFYFLSRNPYKKLESFYKNKLIRDPQTIIHTYEDLKASQLIFFNYLGLSQQTPIDQIKNRLVQMSFREMVQALPDVYMNDPHLHPQSNLIHQVIRGFRINFHFDKFLKIENETDRNFLSSDLGVNLDVRENSSRDFPTPTINWEKETLTIFHNLYRKDFDLLNYSEMKVTSSSSS